MAEKRKPKKSKSSALPSDFTKMVSSVFSRSFEAGLRELEKYWKKPYFVVSGEIFIDEIVLTVSLMNKGQLSATTVHASCDFDPKASSPTAEDLLGACVDAIGGLYAQLLDPKTPEVIEQVSKASLSSFDEVPFVWTAFKINKRDIYLRVDKENPELEKMTENWLEENDPESKEKQAKEQAEAEELFVVAPKKGEGEDEGSGGQTLH